MGKPTGFLEYRRQPPPKRPVDERIRDYHEVEEALPPSELQHQAARCMDCGIPYCHASGCPLANRVPEFNDLVYRGRWRQALDILHACNNFPEITGRICPATCEAACTLSINADPVTIRQIELQVIERGWQEGWIEPQTSPQKTGKAVAIIGSGPAGLAAAQQLARRGHDVVLFEKADRVGGILRYGIPDFKLEKHVIDRRLTQLCAEGVEVRAGVDVGTDVSADDLRRDFHASCLTIGSRVPRDLEAPGRELAGVHFAMDFLTQQNRRNAGEVIPLDERITAEGKSEVVIGGGDTGADCVGTARRQGAKRITQIELLPKPPEERHPDNPWPDWPIILRTSSSHEEGCERLWSIQTKAFLGDGHRVQALRCVRLQWGEPDASGRRSFKEIPGTEFELEAELVLLALGFLRVERGELVAALELESDLRGALIVGPDFMTPRRGVFAAGDCVSGASLVVRAIGLGRQMAEAVGRFLQHEK